MMFPYPGVKAAFDFPSKRPEIIKSLKRLLSNHLFRER